MTIEPTWILSGLAVLVLLIIFAARFYVRSNREVSLVKTGIGGQKVIMDGGTLVIPYFHEVARVNMQTLRLEVRRTGEAALITNDRLRVDVGVTFYLSVRPDREGIARAAQTLGHRTFDPERLLDLIEGMLVDALRSIAARMRMDELHEDRVAFVSAVKDSLTATLERIGLELDSVSLTALDQTPFTALDENNAFNAAGMRTLAEVIAKAKKERAEIDAESDVAVRRSAMSAAKRRLEIELEERRAELAQVQELETLKAAQITAVVKQKAQQELDSAQAQILMEQGIEIARLAKEKDLDIARLEGQIATAQKSQEESRARAQADTARAQAAREEEAIVTARQLAVAERSAARVIVAKAEAEETGIRSQAKKQQLLAEAEGNRAVYEAENLMNERTVSLRTDLARLQALPGLVAEMVKPAEKIESIRINHISGMGGARDPGRGEGAQTPPLNQAVDAILDMAVQLPALKKIGQELGLNLSGGLEAVTDRILSGQSGGGGPASPAEGQAGKEKKDGRKD